MLRLGFLQPPVHVLTILIAELLQRHADQRSVRLAQMGRAVPDLDQNRSWAVPARFFWQ